MKTAKETLREAGRIFEHEEYILSKMEKHAEELLKEFIIWCEPKGWISEDQARLSVQSFKESLKK